ncbi:MAG: PhzF family phenazine biosynthesis protein [Candidatus Promineifilaceae bacterium]
MKFQFYTCDVFTESRFGGNPLAVIPHADGLSDQQMQQIAREFNFSESTFVFPPTVGYSRNIRIFTPAREVPFAGHPNVGTAFVLAGIGAFGEIQSSLSVTFEEKAGLVPVTIRAADGKVTSCELAAPQQLTIGETVPVELVASALSLSVGDIVTETHQPQVASVGLPFVMTELKDRAALEQARANMSGFEEIGQDIRPSLYFYTKAADDFDLRARMFAPLSGVPEDPATGSASCVIAGLLAHYDRRADGRFQWRIAQGVEMGRPSVIQARAEKVGGIVQATGVGGSCIMVSEGYIWVD